MRIRRSVRAARPRAALLVGTALIVATELGLGVTAGHAQSATWSTTPATGDWNTGTNWTPTTVPTDTASFGASTRTTLTFSSSTSINTIQLNAGAPAYTFSVTGANELDINGSGIINNSSNAPTFSASGGSASMLFNAGTAGNAIINNTGSRFVFSNSSSAGAANITNSSGGFIIFESQR